MKNEQLKRQILYAQFLTAAGTPQQVCRALNGLQAQYFAHAQHAVRIRCGGVLPADWPADLVKSWTVRGTMHLFCRQDLPLFLHEGRSHFCARRTRWNPIPLPAGCARSISPPCCWTK